MNLNLLSISIVVLVLLAQLMLNSDSGVTTYVSLPDEEHVFHGEKVSIVVPTYKEVLNIPILTERVFKELTEAGLDGEIIFVDDNSRDGSVEVVDDLISRNYNVRIIVRTEERGLSSAVLRGFRDASHDVVLVMDADLQHDPKYIPALLAPIINDKSDFSVGSRHVGGGGIEGWSWHRRFISWGATLVAKPLIPCSDPMSGFFAMRRQTVQRAPVLNPLGYKIGLELMVRCNVTRITEVPIVFKDRTMGESKLDFRTNLQYLMHVARLYWDCRPKVVLAAVMLVMMVALIILKALNQQTVQKEASVAVQGLNKKS